MESALLSAIGACVGFVGAAVGVWILERSVSDAQLAFMPISTMSASAFRCWASLPRSPSSPQFSLVWPAISAPKLPVADVLKDESRGGTSASRNRLRNTLVIVEIAISLVLLIGGGMMLQGLRALLNQNPGFEPEHVLTFLVTLPDASYPVQRKWPFENPKGLLFAHELVQRLKALPGSLGSSATSGLPASGNLQGYRFSMKASRWLRGRKTLR